MTPESPDADRDSAVNSRRPPAEQPTRVLLDTNALMMPVESDVRLFDELDRLLGGTAARGPGGPRGRDAPSGSDGSGPSGSDGSAPSGSDGSGQGGSDGSGPIPAGYECVVPVAVVEELERLADPDGGGTGGAEARAARVGLDLLDRCSVLDHDAEYADDAVLELAGSCEYVVTNDRPLGERLRVENGPVISLRGRTKLEVTES